MSDTTVLKLITLECLLAQELDGDEIYLRLNGERVWAVDRHAHMSHDLARPHCYDIMDFVGGRRHGAGGWEMIPGFVPGALTWSLTSEAVIEIFEADTFSSDDLIGRQRITSHDAGRGDITVHFEREGARYALTFRLENA